MVSLRWICCAAFAALLTAPAAGQGPLDPVEQARLASDGYYRYLAQSGACRWGRPTLDAVMYREKDLWFELAALEDKAAADAIPSAMPEAQPCGGAADQQARSEAAGNFWRWTTRTLIFAQYSAQAGWTNQLVELAADPINAMEPLRKEIETAMGPDRSRAETEVLVNEARIVLNLICGPRKAERSPTPRVCPEVPETFIAQRPIAEKRARAVEVFNLVLPEYIAKEQRGEFGLAYQFGFDPFDFSSDCKPLASTIYPAAPDTKELADGVLEVSVRSYGRTGVVERDRVKKDGLGYAMVDDAGQPIRRSADSTLNASYDVCF